MGPDKTEPRIDADNDSYAKGDSAIEGDPSIPTIEDAEKALDSAEEGYNAAGDTIALLATNTLYGALGDRWKPTPGELKTLGIGFSALCRERDIDSLPARLMIFAGMTAYLLPRIMEVQKEAKAKLEKAKKDQPPPPIEVPTGTLEAIQS